MEARCMYCIRSCAVFDHECMYILYWKKDLYEDYKLRNRLG